MFQMIVECISDFACAGMLAGTAALMRRKIVHPAGAMRNPGPDARPNARPNAAGGPGVRAYRSSSTLRMVWCSAGGMCHDITTRLSLVTVM